MVVRVAQCSGAVISYNSTYSQLTPPQEPTVNQLEHPVEDPEEGVMIGRNGECELRHRRCVSGELPFVPPPGGEP